MFDLVAELVVEPGFGWLSFELGVESVLMLEMTPGSVQLVEPVV